MSGYFLDLLHDLFEGIVPKEAALFLDTLMKNKYFTLIELNELFTEFPYWSDLGILQPEGHIWPIGHPCPGHSM